MSGVNGNGYGECNTVEPPNKGHIGDNINSAVLSFVRKVTILF